MAEAPCSQAELKSQSDNLQKDLKGRFNASLCDTRGQFVLLAGQSEEV